MGRTSTCVASAPGGESSTDETDPTMSPGGSSEPSRPDVSTIWPTDLKSPYGPLFLLGTYALVPFGIPFALWGLKLAGGAAALGCLALVARSARRVRLDPVRSPSP